MTTTVASLINTAALNTSCPRLGTYEADRDAGVVPCLCTECWASYQNDEFAVFVTLNLLYTQDANATLPEHVQQTLRQENDAAYAQQQARYATMTSEELLSLALCTAAEADTHQAILNGLMGEPLTLDVVESTMEIIAEKRLQAERFHTMATNCQP